MTCRQLVITHILSLHTAEMKSVIAASLGILSLAAAVAGLPGPSFVGRAQTFSDGHPSDGRGLGGPILGNTPVPIPSPDAYQLKPNPAAEPVLTFPSLDLGGTDRHIDAPLA